MWCCGLVVTICFSVSLPIIQNSLVYEIDSDTTCPTIGGTVECNTENGCSTFAAKEDWGNQFKWHWEYPGADTSDFVIRQRCPSMTHNAELWVGGVFAGRTKQAYWSSTNDIDIFDCHGSLLFTMKAKNWGQNVLNSLTKGFSGSKQLEDDKGEVVAYIEGSHFLRDDIRILDLDKELVAKIYRNKLFAFYPKCNSDLYFLIPPASLVLDLQGSLRSRSHTIQQVHLWYLL
jgi:hypothetical protein